MTTLVCSKNSGLLYRMVGTGARAASEIFCLGSRSCINMMLLRNTAIDVSNFLPHGSATLKFIQFCSCHLLTKSPFIFGLVRVGKPVSDTSENKNFCNLPQAGFRRLFRLWRVYHNLEFLQKNTK
jgi:hypothetical protein